MKASDLQRGDIVCKPLGFMDWPRWEHVVTRINGDIIYTIFDNGLEDSGNRHATSVIRGMDWMSVANMDSCLMQPDTCVIRDGEFIHPDVKIREGKEVSP